METFQAKIVNRAATVQPAAAPTKTVQSRAAARSAAQIQMATKVSSPHDPAEKEAESTAKKIMRMTISEGSAAYKSGSGGGIFRQIKSEEKDKKLQTKLQSPYITRFANSGIFTQQKKEEEKIQRKAEGQPQVAPNVTADIQQSMAGGSPLPPSVRRFMEPRFRANFSQVKVHTSDKAAKLNRQFNARAFTMGNHLFFGKEQFKPESHEGKELIAHELTHTIQQGEVIQRSEEVNVTQQSPVQVQRWGLGDALNYFADKVYLIPGFRMLTLILGVNPINMSRIERSAANILRALVEFIPGGTLITQALDNYGIFDKIGNWVEQHIKSLGIVGSTIKQAITGFLDSLSWKDILDLGGVWNRAKPIFTEPIDRIISFAKGLATGILQFIKEALLRPLAKLAEGTRGYDLLKAVLGKDPVTGDPVPRTADTLIGGFMKLIGQEEVWNNLKKANAVAHAWAWFQGAMSALMGFVGQIPTLFIQAFKSLQLEDIILLPRAFAKVGAVFGKFIGDFMSWAGNAVWNLLEIIFAVVAPGAIPYLKKAAGAFRSILKNPISFVGNLVQAGKRGFLQFADNIGKHLKTSLIQWLTGTLVGVYLPQSFEIREIIKFVLSVLNLTWQTIRQKLVRVVGEPVVTRMETGLDIVITLVKEGPAAAWEKIKEQVTNLKEIVIEGIMSFVTSTIVQNAVTKLVSMLNPAGVVIQAILAVYNTIMFFVERLKQIAQVAMAFLDSISAIAAGVIAAAAGRVEQTLTGLLTLAISFLARFAGLGKVGEAVINIIKKLQAPIDKALDAVVGWIRERAQRLIQRVAGGTPQQRLDKALIAAVAAVNRFAGKRVGAAILRPLLGAIRLRYQLQSLDVVAEGGHWVVKGVVNPGKQEKTKAKVDITKEKCSCPEPENTGATNTESSCLLAIGYHPLKGKNRQSHHVPANQLSVVFSSIYDSIGMTLKNNLCNSYKEACELSEKMNKRSLSINEKYKDGNNLSAILIHEDTHLTGEKAVHRGNIMGDVLNDIKNNIKGKTTERIIVMKSDGSRMVANLQSKHWHALIGKIFELENEKSAGVNSNLIEIKARDQRSIDELIKLDLLRIKDKKGNKDNDESIKADLLRIKDKINSTVTRTFDNALENGLSSVKVAMEKNKEKECGDHQRILNDLCTSARQYWKPIVDPLE